MSADIWLPCIRFAVTLRAGGSNEPTALEAALLYFLCYREPMGGATLYDLCHFTGQMRLSVEGCELGPQTGPKTRVHLFLCSRQKVHGLAGLGEKGGITHHDQLLTRARADHVQPLRQVQEPDHPLQGETQPAAVRIPLVAAFMRVSLQLGHDVRLRFRLETGVP